MFGRLGHLRASKSPMANLSQASLDDPPVGSVEMSAVWTSPPHGSRGARDIADLRPLIAEAIRMTLDRIRADEAKLADRLGFAEPEAAALITRWSRRRLVVGHSQSSKAPFLADSWSTTYYYSCLCVDSSFT